MSLGNEYQARDEWGFKIMDRKEPKILEELITIRAEVKETRKLVEEIHNMCQRLIYGVEHEDQ